MKNRMLIDKIKKAAEADARKRKDIRYRRAMAFLTKKGFLQANTDFEKFYQAKVNINDFIWAGENVEPRILEVLPAVVARLPKAVRVLGYNKKVDQLKIVVQDLKKRKDLGHDFVDIPYDKLKVWMNLSLRDRRTKVVSKKKVMKSFRLSPEVINRIAELRKLKGLGSDSALIESLIVSEV